MAAKRKLAQFVDVFCDKGAFTAEETEQIFAAAEKHGLSVRAHMGQLSETGLQPFLRFNPASFDHMDHVNEDDIPQLAKRDTVATLVPGANYFLGLEGISERAPSDRCRRAGRAGNGLQPRHVADHQHADGNVAGLHAHEDVAGGSSRGGDDQRGVGAPRGGAKGQHRTGKRR